MDLRQIHRQQCMVPSSDECECQGQRSRSLWTENVLCTPIIPRQRRNGLVCCIQHVTMHCQQGRPACSLCLVKDLFSSFISFYRTSVTQVCYFQNVTEKKQKLWLGHANYCIQQKIVIAVSGSCGGCGTVYCIAW